MSIEALNQSINLKKQIELKFFWKHILPMMLVIYIIVIPMFYIVIVVKGKLGLILLLPLAASIIFSIIIRYFWLRATFEGELKIYKQNIIAIKPDIKFIEFSMFCEKFKEKTDLLSVREQILVKLNEELISHLASLGEHRFSIISFGVILAIISNFVSYILQQAFPVSKISDLTNHFVFVVITCFLLAIPWGISRGFFDRFSNKKRLRELREYLEWFPVLERNRLNK
ncbi:hypothetical protein GSbR_09400 [Geobacter sp. SVR]|nr:hypothetical protein GSVR_12640 [Geobacter sp. SVR]GCF84340.1 hypothetical protein GSbR_09400 [Geobacter sp. SVR]